jgi:hypothetical protein
VGFDEFVGAVVCFSNLLVFLAAKTFTLCIMVRKYMS